MYIQLKMAAERTGLTEEELMTLALNNMLQFYYPDEEKGWQPVPDEKIREVYIRQNYRPNFEMMAYEEYRNFVQGSQKIWFKEMFFLLEEDACRIIARSSYEYKKIVPKPQPENQGKNVFTAIGAAVRAFDLRREEGGNGSRESQNVSASAESYEGHADRSSSVRKQKRAVPPTPRPRQRMFSRHKPTLWMAYPERYPNIVEEFRLLANKIAFISDTSRRKVFLMTGTHSNVGTSTILFNTGLMMGRSMLDRKILIVDTNVYHPSLHTAFDTFPAVCLMDYLFVGATLSDVVQPTFLPNLDIITCNRIDDPLLSPFTVPAFSLFFKDIREKYTIILLDSAPALRSSHTKMLLPEADGVIIVAKAGETQMKTLEELVRQLHMEDVTLLGSFLNKRRYPVPKWLYRII